MRRAGTLLRWIVVVSLLSLPVMAWSEEAPGNSPAELQTIVTELEELKKELIKLKQEADVRKQLEATSEEKTEEGDKFIFLPKSAKERREFSFKISNNFKSVASTIDSTLYCYLKTQINEKIPNYRLINLF